MGSKSQQCIYPFLDCLSPVHTWVHQQGRGWGGVGLTENSGHQLQLLEPTLHTQKPPNPLTANEHSCSLDRGDLNFGFVMTLAWCFPAKRNHHLIFLIPASKLKMKGWMATGLVKCKLHTAFNSMCWRHCYVNMPRFCYQWGVYVTHCEQRRQGEVNGSNVSKDCNLQIMFMRVGRFHLKLMRT